MNFVNNIKTDIRFCSNGTIELSAKVSQLLGIENGDYISFLEENEEFYIFIHAKASQPLSCKGKCTRSRQKSKFMRVAWKEACTKVINNDGRAPEARYRVGEPIQQNGQTLLPIITRRNYAAERN